MHLIEQWEVYTNCLSGGLRKILNSFFYNLMRVEIVVLKYERALA